MSGQVNRGLAVNGPLAAGIPGEIAGLEHLARNYGKLPLAKSLAPAIRIAREGFPVVDGLRSFLAGVRCLFGYRDFLLRSPPTAAGAAVDAVERWRPRLAAGVTLDELESSQLLTDFGVPVNPAALADSWQKVLAAASELGYPLVMKSAQQGLLHKTDQKGVVLGVGDEAELEAAWADLSSRLGERVLISRMVDHPGVEMVLGMVRDEQFGPLVMLGFGGVNVESLRDVACALPPFDRQEDRRLIDSLRLRSLLDGLRDRPPLDIDAFCAAAERFSVMAAALGEVLEEIDVNPVIVHSEGCVAVDALVLGHQHTETGV